MIIPQPASLVVGGAFLPHAPQFFTRPASEDMENVARVERVAATIGAELRALAPDLWIIFSNDHAEQFFHTVAPPFTIHAGGDAGGHFAGRDFHWQVPGEIGLALVRSLYEQGFDPAFSSTARIDYAIGIPLTHLGHTAPILPIYVNAYLPPQPSPERCYAFGQAVGRAVSALGLRTVVLASGGMSHFPGTDRYERTELAWDTQVVEALRAGHLKSLIGHSAAELDARGNIELRCWAAAAGAMGERVPDIVEMNPSWHHVYVSLGWFSPPRPPAPPHYPATTPELVPLINAVHALAHEAQAREHFLANPDGYADAYGLTGAPRVAFLAMDVPAMVQLGAHPLVPFLANIQVQLSRKRDGA